MQDCGFTFKHYRDILLRARELGYRITGFRDADPSVERFIVLRHDIDFAQGVERARDMAGIEAACGATATYFIKVHCYEYNPFAYRPYVIWREIMSQGHEIGLHFEAADVGNITGEDHRGVFRREKAALEAILDRPVASAAQHGDHSIHSDPDPYRFFYRHDALALGISFHPDQPAFREGVRYLSDSNSHWREGCVCKHLGEDNRLQVLVHPEWWFRDFYHTW